jgi:25S rRNA (cytosine2278-C5)-methyltransferase
MNFYFDAAKVLDRLDAKQGSIKGILAQEVAGNGVDDRNRKRMTAAVIRTLECEWIEIVQEVRLASS